MSRLHWIYTAVMVLLMSSSAVRAADQPVIKVWPDKVPGAKGDIGPEKFQDPNPGDKKPIARLGGISEPTLTVFPAPKEIANGTSVVICPGGGYHILAWDLEGTEVAEWLNKQGVTAFVLKYRVPKRSPENIEPRQDAQRAIRVVRSQAKELNIDPNKIGILGFSAGGHLAAMTAIDNEKTTYDKVDAADEVSARPDFAVLVYPAYLTNKENTALSPDVKVSEKTPPMFLAHAGDDPVTPMSSVLLYGALKQAKVPAELHVYATGGHGYGLREGNSTATNWPARCEEWLKGRGLTK